MESVPTCLLYWSKSHKLAGTPEFFLAGKKKKSSLVTNDFQNSLIVLALMVTGSP